MTDLASIRPLTLDSALFLDLDGTLIDIAPRHDQVWGAPDLPGVLARLRDARGGALAIGSGRPRSAEELTRLLKKAGFRHVARVGTRMPLVTSLLVART